MKMLKAKVIENIALVSLFRTWCVLRLFSTILSIEGFSQKKSRYVKAISTSLYKFIASKVRPKIKPIKMNKKTPRIRLIFRLNKLKGKT